MAIINNRDKIQSEISSQKFRDNYDAIFSKKDKEKENGKTKICSICSTCSRADNVCDCTCLQNGSK